MRVCLGLITAANASEATINNGFASSKSMHLIFSHIFVDFLFCPGIGIGCNKKSVIKENVYGASLPRALLNRPPMLVSHVTEYVKEMS